MRFYTFNSSHRSEHDSKCLVEPHRRSQEIGEWNRQSTAEQLFNVFMSVHRQSMQSALTVPNAKTTIRRKLSKASCISFHTIFTKWHTATSNTEHIYNEVVDVLTITIVPLWWSVCEFLRLVSIHRSSNAQIRLYHRPLAFAAAVFSRLTLNGFWVVSDLVSSSATKCMSSRNIYEFIVDNLITATPIYCSQHISSVKVCDQRLSSHCVRCFHSSGNINSNNKKKTHIFIYLRFCLFESQDTIAREREREGDENNGRWKENEINSMQTFSHEINIRRLIMMNE